MACLKNVPVRDLKESQLRGQHHTLSQLDSQVKLLIPRHDLLKQHYGLQLT